MAVRLIRSKKHPGAVFVATGPRKRTTFLAKVYAGPDAEEIAELIRSVLVRGHFGDDEPFDDEPVDVGRLGSAADFDASNLDRAEDAGPRRIPRPEELS